MFAAERQTSPADEHFRAPAKHGVAPARTVALARQPVDLRAYRAQSRLIEYGNGTSAAPLELPLQETPNESGCVHCPVDACDCNLFADLFAEAEDEVAEARVTEVAGKNYLCAKSILPPFVTRLAAELRVTPDDTFYDLGSGNGSVLFQVAFMTGARCVGVELSEHNAQLSRQIWSRLKPKLERVRGGRRMPDVQIVTGDLADVIMAPSFIASPNVAVWTANLLMPRSVTHFMSERFRDLPPGARLACLDDLYPHGRACSQTRDPEAFELFDMFDYRWSQHSVEWTGRGGGSFFIHVRK